MSDPVQNADFFRQPLAEMIDLRHPLAVLGSRLPWAQIEAALAPHFARQVREGRAVMGTTRLQIVEYLLPELGPFGVLDPDSQDVATAIGQHAQGQIDGRGAHDSVLADLESLMGAGV